MRIASVIAVVTGVALAVGFFTRQAGLWGGRPAYARVAVQACENEAGEASRYLERGLQDEVGYRLSGARALKVSLGQPPLPWGADASEANSAAAVPVHRIECKLRPAAEGVDVEMRLVSGEGKAALWSSRRTVKEEDLLGFIAQVAGRTADSMGNVLDEADRVAITRNKTKSPEALALYLKAHQTWQTHRVADAEEAIRLLDRAIALDPNFAFAYIERTYAREVIAQFGNLGQSKDQLLEGFSKDIDRALAIDPYLGEAYVRRGFLLMHGKYDVEGARLQIRRAMELAPFSWQVHFQSAQSLGLINDPSIVFHSLRYRELKPDDPFAWAHVTSAYYHQREYGRALAEADAGMARFPKDWLQHWMKGWALQALGRCEEALASENRALELYGSRHAEILPDVASALACLGRVAEAEALLKEIQASDTGSGEARTLTIAPLASLGRYDEALDALESELKRSSLFAMYFLHEFWLDPVRDHPRFIALEKQYGRTPVPREQWVLPKSRPARDGKPPAS
jgi:tetratricopeptide (TPR) repeat protein